MFDIGFLELLVIGVLGLLVLGPERLPGAIKTVSYWVTRIRRSFQQVKLELEREVDISELKRQIHNDSIMDELAKAKGDIDEHIEQTRDNLQKHLGDENYSLENTFSPATPADHASEPRQDHIPSEQDSLPDHPPLPDPDELHAQDDAVEPGNSDQAHRNHS